MYPTASPWPISTSSPLAWSTSGSCESSITGWTSDNSDGSRSGPGTKRGWWNWARKSSHGQDWETKYDNVNKQREEEDDVRFGARASFGQAQRGMEVEQDWDKPDLLDSLIMEDEELKMLQKRKVQSQPKAANLHLPSLENLLKLLELEYSSPPPGRPITGSQHAPLPPSQYKDNLHVQALISHQVPLVFPGQFPPINFKIPPPHHPPAIPASFDLPSPLHYPLPPCTPRRSDISPSLPSPSPGSPADILLRVEEARWQLKALETDRKKTEAALAKQHPGKTVSSYNTVPVPRLPPAPSSLDKLVVDSLREQGRVVILLDRIKTIRGEIFSPGLHSSLAMWKESVVTVRNMRRRERMGHVERAGEEEMGAAVARLSGEIRRARSVLWAVLAGGADKM
eukprot:GFUD01000842.1.p1 GENE.GFUD01000842.1~~GFUD01000842.1.p1  ORF type:complete len:397 (+),score=139.29 GFUD01000842.1:69-1259(+)